MLIISAIATVALAALVSQFASTFPDGLERVSERFGFAEKGRAALGSPVPDYSMRWMSGTRLSGSIAGVLGAGVVFLCACLVGRALLALRRRRARGSS
jgi:hypothetical protein